MKSKLIPSKKRQLNPFIEDIFYEFLSFINHDLELILNCRLVCKDWNYLIMTTSNLWNNVEVYILNLQKLPAQFKNVLTRIKCNSSITDNDLEQVSHFNKLKQLNLDFCNRITDDGLKHLMKLSSLQQL